MQSVKIYTFWEAITSNLMSSSSFWQILIVRIRVQQNLFVAQNLSERVVHKLKAYEKRAVLELFRSDGFTLYEQKYLCWYQIRSELDAEP